MIKVGQQVTTNKLYKDIYEEEVFGTVTMIEGIWATVKEDRGNSTINVGFLKIR